MTRSIPQARLEGTTAADLIFSVRVRAMGPAGEIDDVDLAGVAITFAIQDAGGADRLTATLGDMISLPGDAGVFTVAIPRARMSGLSPGVYDVGCVVANSLVTCQLFNGRLTVRDEVVG